MRWLVLLAALVAATLIHLSLGEAVVTEPVVSVDTDPTGNGAIVVDTIDSCREVTVGSEFEIDVTIELVTDLAGFEADLGYDPAILEVIGVDYNYFLATVGSVTNWGEAPTSLNPDTDGTLSMVAALFPLPQAGATGEGVVARVTLRTVAGGPSYLNLGYIKLPDINNQPIGEDDDDDYFDGPVANGEIAVGQSCSSPTPTPDPPVGGIAEYPDVAQSVIDKPASAAGSSGTAARDYIILAGGLATAALAATAGMWYVRRRWLG